MAKGYKTGGRKKGVPNKATAKGQEEIAASGKTPLEYLLAVMRDEKVELKDRQWAAAAAAPYVHPRLAAVEHSGNEDRPPRLIVEIRDPTRPASAS